MTFRFSPRLILAALATGLAVFALGWTEQYDPAGSPVGWLIFLGLAAAHAGLMRRTPPGERVEAPFPIPRKGIAVIAFAVFFVLGGSIGLRHTEQIFQEPVLPKRSAQLGLMTQVTARMIEDQPLYHFSYPRDGYTERNPFPVGLTLPFLAAQALELDWRFATLGAVALLAVLLAVGAAALARSSWQPGDEAELVVALVAMALAGGALFWAPRSLNFLQWGHTPPLWPLMAGLGLCLAARWTYAAAAVAGLLAAMNPGWLVLLPAVGALLWRERPSIPVLAVLLFFPAVAYGAYREQFEALWQGVLGNPFSAGHEMAEEGTAWRYASLHGITDFLMLRPAVYVLALLGVFGCAAAIFRSESRERRMNLFLLAAFLVVAAGPATYFFHWMGHGALLAGFLPAVCLAMGEEQQPVAAQGRSAPALLNLRPGKLEAGAFVAGLAGVLVLATAPLQVGYPQALNNRADHRLPPDENLFMGWNVTSGDHTWGREPNMATGFILDRPVAGLMEMRIGTVGGDFTPYNPFVVRVNGIAHKEFYLLPGGYGYARLSLGEEDVHVGFNVVELEARWARTARSVNMSADDRPLSINFQGLRFLPADLVPKEYTIVSEK